MRAKYAALFFIISALAWSIPSGAFAATNVTSDITSDTIWTKDESPYLVQDWITVDENATLSIEPGVIVQFDSDGWMDVLGRLLATGTSNEPILFMSATTGWYGINFFNQETSSSLDNIVIRYADTAISDYFSKDLSISNARVENGRYGIEAYGSHLSLNNFSAEKISNEAMDIRDGSDVTLKNITLRNVNIGIEVYVGSTADISNLLIDSVSHEALDVYVRSSVHIASSTMTNILGRYGAIEIFDNSSVDISHLTMDKVPNGDAIEIFDHSTVTLNDSSISNSGWYESIAVFNSGLLTAKNVKMTGGDGDGIITFAGGSVDMKDSIISGFYYAGIADYGSSSSYPPNSLSLVNNEIKNNDIGLYVSADNSSYAISNNSIHDNASFGLKVMKGVVDVSQNFWGDSSGPYVNPGNLTGKGDKILYAPGSTVTFSPWLISWGDPCATPGACASNVLFLPGIEGSRLYEGTGCGETAEEKLWEPIGESLIKILRGAGDDKVKRLFLDSTGQSVCSDTYAKEDDIIDSVKGSNIYQLFIDEMNGLKTDGTINDWEPVAYDWRLSLTDLLSKGAERNGRIYYTEATSTPYIEQTLRALAGSSKTGKVTIVAHSNGGLVAKALLNKLGSSPSSSLVDKIVMVGAPQSGAPVAIGALLYGYDQGISKWGIPILHSAVARELAQNSPMAYHLLPSDDYLESTVGDSTHPIARFAGDAYASELSAYGATITNTTELDNFLIAEALNANLVDYANTEHSILDFWVPPEGIEVNQIAGWGADTVAGIDFYTLSGVSALSALSPQRMYKPIFTEDGDGTVPIPSALMMASSTNVKMYWVNLDLYKIATSIKIEHRNIFEIPTLEEFIKNIIKNSTSTLPEYISITQPSPTNKSWLTFFLHSPLTIQLEDSGGNITGLAEDGSMTQDIPDSTYGEFGDVKYITVPEGSSYQLTMHGQASGTFSLDIQESSGGVITASSTIANVPTTENTLANLTISNGIDTASALTVDENGDGKNIITLAPKVGETVSYEPLEDPEPVEGLAPEPTVSSAGGSSRRIIPIPVTVPVIVATTTGSTHSNDSGQASSPQATAQPVATTPRLSVATPRVSKRSLVPPPPVTVTNTIPNFSQTASVYNASQQSVLKKLGAMVYNGLYGFWLALKKFF